MPGVAAMPARHARTSVLRTSRMLVACTGRNMMTASVDIAAWLMSRHGTEKRLTNLSLHRLCFFAQVESLRSTGTTVFDDPIAAWRCGPVCPAVYHAYERYGRASIPAPVMEAPTCPTARRWSWTCCRRTTAGCRPMISSGFHTGTVGPGRRLGCKARTPRLRRI